MKMIINVSQTAIKSLSKNYIVAQIGYNFDFQKS